MEWLRIRSEQTFDNFNRLFNSPRSFVQPAAQSEAIELFAFYETTKARASILLSSDVFDKHNSKFTEEWERIRKRLGL